MGEYEIIKIDQDTWRIEDSGVRFFLLKGEKKAVLIDSGMQTRDVKEMAERLTNLPVELVNTHADVDHIGGNDSFPSFKMHPSEAVNYYCDKKRVGIIDPVYDGDVIDLGGRELEVMLVPGHTPGSIMLLDRRKGVVYGGDIIQDGNIFLFGPMRDIHAYALSLKRLEKWKGLYDIIYPSHGTFPVSPSLVPKLINGAVSVMRHEVEGTEKEVFGMKIMVYDIGCAKIMGEI
ncbi:MAG: MBL fold metallo-hydrolase [Candidatus Ornithospirochaeta sp.]